MRRHGLLVFCFAILSLYLCPAEAADKGFIAGNVVWSEGGAIGDAKICVHRFDGAFVSTINADDQGMFRIEIPAGSYKISAEKQNYVKEYFPGEYSIKEADPIRVYGGEERHIVLALDLGGWVSGNFAYYGDEIDYALLTAIKMDQPYAGWYKSQALSGPFPSAYAISGLLPGVYKILGRAWGKNTEFYPGVLRIEDAAIVSVAEGAGAPNISFMLDPAGWGSIQGRVYNMATGEGFGGIPVLAYQWVNYREDPALDSAITNADGSFLFSIPSGDYYVMAVYPDYLGDTSPNIIYYFNRYDQRQADLVSVEDGQQVIDIDFPIDILTRHDLTITGSIFNSSSGLGLDDVTITAIDFNSGEIMGTASSYNEGEFIVNGLSPRDYLLMFSGNYIIPYYFPKAYSWQDAEVITLSGSTGDVRTDAITQDYGDNGLAIVGRVIAMGLPLEGARIYAFPFNQIDPIAYALSDAYGEYSIISGLATGQYTVICDNYGYDAETYPIPVSIDLLSDPVADDVNFELTQTLSTIASETSPRMSVELGGNYPNPFNSRTIISLYSVRDGSYNTVFSVYNLLGQVVGRKEISITPGFNIITWDISDFAASASSGVYYYRVAGSNGIGRMILLK